MNPLKPTSPSSLPISVKQVEDRSKVSEVGENAIHRPSLWESLVNFGQYLLRNPLVKKEAEAKEFLSKHLIDIDGLIEELPAQLGPLFQFLKNEEAPVADNPMSDDSERKTLLNAAIWIVMGNVAKLVVKEGEKISLEEFSYRATLHLSSFFGERLDAIDAEVAHGKEADQDVFHHLVNDFLNTYLSLDGFGANLVITFIKRPLSKLIAEQYVEIKKMIRGENLQPGRDKTVIKPLMHRLFSFMTMSYCKRSSAINLQAILNQTGETEHGLENTLRLFRDQLQSYIQNTLMKSYLSDYLPDNPELAKAMTDMILHKLLLNGLKAQSDREIGSVKIEDVIAHLQKQISSAYHGGENELNNLLNMFIKEWITKDNSLTAKIFNRYKVPVIDLLKGFITPLFNHVKEQEAGEQLCKTLFGGYVEEASSLVPLIDQIGDWGAEAVLNLLIQGKNHSEGGAKALFNMLHAPLHAVVRGWVWKIFFALIPPPQDGQKWKVDEVMPKIFENLINFLERESPDFLSVIRNDWKELNVEARKSQAARLLRPLLEKFINQYITNDLEAEIPLPKKFQHENAELILNSVTQVFSNILVISSSVLIDQQKNEDALNQMFNPDGGNLPSSPVKASHVVGKMMQAALPYQCRMNKKAWGDAVFDKLKTVIPDPVASEKIAAAGSKAVSSLIGYLSNGDNPQVKKMLAVVDVYVETMMLSVLNQLGKKVQKLDEAIKAGDLSHMEKILDLLFNELKPHLEICSENSALLAEKDQDAIRKAFLEHDKLHKALKSEEERLAVFQGWSSKLLKMTAIEGAESLPIPDFLQDQVWDQLQLSVLPTLLLTTFDKIRDPFMMDQLVGMVLSKISNDWDKKVSRTTQAKNYVYPGDKDDYVNKNDTSRQYDDEYQKRLEEKMGELSQLFIKLRQTPFIQNLIKKTGVQKFIGEAVGQPLRTNLRAVAEKPEDMGEPVPLNHLLAGAFEAFVDSVKPCEKEEGQWVYFNDSIHGIGKVNKSDQPDFTRIFPKDDKQSRILSHLENAQKWGRRAKVKYGISKVIHEQIGRQAKLLVNAPWDRFVQSTVKFLRGLFSEKYKDRVEHWVKKIMMGMRYYVIYPMVVICILPIWLIVKKSIGSALSKMAEHQVDSLKNDIHQNVTYHFVDGVIEMLEKEMA